MSRSMENATPASLGWRRWFHDLGRDVPYAIRTLARAPGFASVSILTIGLGIGANAAVFSVVDRVLLRPLPFEASDRLVRLWESQVDDPAWRGSASVPNVLDWRRQSRAFASLAAYSSEGMNLEGGTSPERVQVSAAETSLFQLLRAQPLRGRTFDSRDAEAGRDNVVVISAGFWQRALGGRADVVGSTVRLDQRPFTVIGVMPESFRWPATSTRVEAWRPFVPSARDLESRGSHFLSVVGRLAPGVTIEQAGSEMKGIAAQLATQYPAAQTNRTVAITSLHSSITESVRPALITMMVSVALVLLIACANVANLQLARAASRQREVAIRLAIGADTGRLVRQLLSESVVIALLGFALAMLFAYWGVGALAAAAGTALPTTAPVHLDARVFGILFAVALLCGLACGLAPAIFARPGRLHDVLTSAGTRTTSTRGHQRFRRGLVMVQVALSLTLMVGAGLLMRAFVALTGTDSGLQTENAVTFLLSPVQADDSTRYTLPERLYSPVLERVRALPGVSAAGMVSLLPIESWGWNGDYWIDGRPEPAAGKMPLVEFRETSPGYFAAAGIPIVQGRDLRDGDQRDASQPVVVNKAFADLHFPGATAIGERLRRGRSADAVFTIVGVAGSVRQAGLDRDPLPEMNLPYGSHWAGFPSMTLVVRSSMPMLALRDAVVGAVRSVDPTVPVSNVQTLATVIETSLASRSIGLWLMSTFAALAIILAATGLYGVMAYLVTERTREFGVRMALGADGRRILRQVLGQSATLAAAGIVMGLVVAYWLSRLLANQLVSVSVHDPVVFAAAPLVLALTAVAAALIPAMRAARTPPQVALRSD